MSEPTGWRKTMQEPHAIGWIGLIVVVLVIGVGALIFGRDDGDNGGNANNAAKQASPISTGQAAK